MAGETPVNTNNAGNPLTILGAGQGNAYYQDIVTSLQNLQVQATGYQSNANNPGYSQASVSSTARSKVNNVIRSPWIMSTTQWLRQSPPTALLWAANPSDITWTMAQRSTHSKNLVGTVLHVWPDNTRGTFFDEFRLTFTLQSGNIMPVFLGTSSNASGTFTRSNWQIAPGMANFLDFMLLVDAPKLYTDSSNNVITNLISIQYCSNLFPQITLFGMFDSGGIRFTDSAQNPNQVTSWSADFVVYDTAPRLSDFSGSAQNSSILNNWLDARLKNMSTGTAPPSAADRLLQTATNAILG